MPDAALLPPNACRWCGHKPHPHPCPGRIQLTPKTDAPCPCTRALKEKR